MKLKKIVFTVISLLVSSESLTRSKSFFRPRSVTQDTTFEDALTYYHRYRVRRHTFNETNEYKRQAAVKREGYLPPSTYLNPRADNMDYLGVQTEVGVTGSDNSMGLATEVDVTYESDTPIVRQSNLQSSLSRKPNEKKNKLKAKQKAAVAQKNKQTKGGQVSVEALRTDTVYQESSLLARSGSLDDVMRKQERITQQQFEKQQRMVVRGDDENHFRFQFYAKPFYQQSNNGKALARYFLPNELECLNIQEDGTGDVNPIWFRGIISPDDTSYSSEVTIRPRRKSYGIMFNAYSNIPVLCDRLWFGVTTAVVHARHEMRVVEEDRKQEGTFSEDSFDFKTICDAFNNPKFCAGKIPCCPNVSRTGLDDIQFKVGYDFQQTQDYHVAFYFVATAPTGKRPDSATLFQPLVGSKNPTLGAGLDWGRVLTENNDFMISWLFDFKYQHAFGAREKRSFDLDLNGDWSRYLLVVEEDSPAVSFPGINLFTLDADVTPGSKVNMWTAFHYEGSSWDLEFGYNLWWRQKEQVGLRCDLPDNFGILDLSGLGGTPTSSSTANISQSVEGANATVSDATFVRLETKDLNLDSAAHPRALTHKIYASIGRDTAFRGRPMLFGINGSYEFAQGNTALEQWAFWANVGISF